MDCNPAQPFNITPAREFTLEADPDAKRSRRCCEGVTRTLGGVDDGDAMLVPPPAVPSGGRILALAGNHIASSFTPSALVC